MSSQRRPRYRVENGRSCIDIQLKSSRQLFDGRDPAPFRERDLDPAAVEYISGAVQELAPKADVMIVVWIAEEPGAHLPVEVINEAVHGHFSHEHERLDRQIRQHMQRGYLFLLTGFAALVVLLSLAELTAELPPGKLQQILREGLSITGWVAMWRPLEVLLYDWWPLMQRRGLARRLADIPLSIRHEPGPFAAAGGR